MRGLGYRGARGERALDLSTVLLAVARRLEVVTRLVLASPHLRTRR